MNVIAESNKRKVSNSTIAMHIMLFYCYFYTMADVIFQSKLIIVTTFFLAIGLCVISALKDRRIRLNIYSIMWLIGALIALFHNQRIATGDFAPKMICWFAMVVCFVLIKDLDKWIEPFIKMICIYTLIHVSFAWLFKFVPELFYIFSNLFGGTSKTVMLSHYASGYLLGITTHYSTLAIYLGNGLVAILAQYTMEEDRKKKKILMWFLIGITITLAMIGKRGMLVFVVCTVVLYSVIIKARSIKSFLPVIMKYIGIIVACIVGLIVLAYTVMPQLVVTLTRFMEGTVGTDITSGRGRMWELALELFGGSPLIGVGWFGYREAYESAWYHGSSFQQLDTHNIYLQLLCETGIVGFTIFIIAMFGSFSITVKDLRKCIFGIEKEELKLYKNILAVSVVLQMLFLLYGLTGNPLYDPQCFVVYFFSVAMAYTIHKKIRRTIG